MADMDRMRSGVTGRRCFFGQVAAAMAGGGIVAAAPGEEKALMLPTVTIAGKSITRLIVGSNPMIGASQATRNLSRMMDEYFTAERIAELLLHIERVGINTFQGNASEKVREGVRLARERGSNIQYICLTSGGPEAPSLEKILESKPMALAHHGGVTDRLFRQGKSEAIRDFILMGHDKGLPVGISSHVPENIQAVEEKGWGNDFFMNCFYNVVRTKDEMVRAYGDAPVDNLYYMTEDPKKMTAVIRQSRKPCLGFKILAAGRLCWTPKSVEETFQFAFGNIKATDGVIVGMLTRFEDEPGMNAGLVRKYGG